MAVRGALASRDNLLARGAGQQLHPCCGGAVSASPAYMAIVWQQLPMFK